jgi:hypothetical protein
LNRISPIARAHANYLGSYTANFGAFRNAEFKVTVQNGRLAVDIPNLLVFELEEPDVDGLRHFKVMDQVAVSFNLDDSGNVTSMLLHESGFVNELIRGLPIQEETYPEDMEKYVGFYQTEDPTVTVEVLVTEGRLALNISGQPTLIELYPPDDLGKWYFRVNPTIAISFNETEDDGVTSFTVHLPDGLTLLRPRMVSDEK